MTTQKSIGSCPQAIIKLQKASSKQWVDVTEFGSLLKRMEGTLLSLVWLNFTLHWKFVYKFFTHLVLQRQKHDFHSYDLKAIKRSPTGFFSFLCSAGELRVVTVNMSLPSLQFTSYQSVDSWFEYPKCNFSVAVCDQIKSQNVGNIDVPHCYTFCLCKGLGRGRRSDSDKFHRGKRKAGSVTVSVNGC